MYACIHTIELSSTTYSYYTSILVYVLFWCFKYLTSFCKKHPNSRLFQELDAIHIFQKFDRVGGDCTTTPSYHEKYLSNKN